MAAQLNHPNIVPIYSVDERDGVVYFVMALVEGTTLALHLHESPRSSFDEVRRVIGDVADALDYAHHKGVVHRDIKPDNIMLDRGSGRTMVTDFGIARAAAGDSRLTVTGVAVGTPAYMSPEQALGERDVDGRSDIYSLGVVAYQMLTGEQPFKAANTPAMLVKHVSEVPRPVHEKRPDVPAPIARAVEIALAKDPAARWPTGAAFRDAIRAAAVADAPAPPPRLEQLSSTGYVNSPVSGGRPGTPGASAPPPVGIPGFILPAPPISYDRDEWRDWRDELKGRAVDFREQRAAWRDQRRAYRHGEHRRVTRRSDALARRTRCRVPPPPRGKPHHTVDAVRHQHAHQSRILVVALSGARHRHRPRAALGHSLGGRGHPQATVPTRPAGSAAGGTGCRGGPRVRFGTGRAGTFAPRSCRARHGQRRRPCRPTWGSRAPRRRRPHRHPRSPRRAYPHRARRCCPTSSPR